MRRTGGGWDMVLGSGSGVRGQGSGSGLVVSVRNKQPLKLNRNLLYQRDRNLHMGHMPIIPLIFQRSKTTAQSGTARFLKSKESLEKKGPILEGCCRAAVQGYVHPPHPPRFPPLIESSRLQESHLHQRVMIPLPFPWRRRSCS